MCHVSNANTTVVRRTVKPIESSPAANEKAATTSITSV